VDDLSNVKLGLSSFGLLSLSVACAAGSVGTIGSGDPSDPKSDNAASAASDSSSDGGSASDSGSVPTTCVEASEKAGCCVDNVLYYCSPTLTSKACTDGKVCGWDTSHSYYDCVDAPGADPSGTHPFECK
jgi:hypothetical protein